IERIRRVVRIQSGNASGEGHIQAKRLCPLLVGDVLTPAELVDEACNVAAPEADSETLRFVPYDCLCLSGASRSQGKRACRLQRRTGGKQRCSADCGLPDKLAPCHIVVVAHFSSFSHEQGTASQLLPALAPDLA